MFEPSRPLPGFSFSVTTVNHQPSGPSKNTGLAPFHRGNVTVRIRGHQRRGSGIPVNRLTG